MARKSESHEYKRKESGTSEGVNPETPIFLERTRRIALGFLSSLTTTGLRIRTQISSWPTTFSLRLKQRRKQVRPKGKRGRKGRRTKSGKDIGEEEQGGRHRFGFGFGG